MKLIIDRAKWFRGKGWRFSKLLLPDGTRCCVGFYGKACGASDEKLLDVATAQHVGSPFPSWASTAYGVDIQILYEVNDDPGISDETRENRIAEIFARHNVQVEFVGESAVKP